MDRFDVASIRCSCGGTPKEEDCTKEERDELGCGRTYDCCSRAARCDKCGTRWLFALNAPDTGW